MRIRAGAGGIVSGRMPAKRCRRVPSRCRGDPATRSPTDCLTDWPFGSLRRLLHARLNTTPRVEIMRRNERPWIVGKFKLHANSGMRCDPPFRDFGTIKISLGAHYLGTLYPRCTQVVPGYYPSITRVVKLAASGTTSYLCASITRVVNFRYSKGGLRRRTTRAFPRGYRPMGASERGPWSL